MQGPQSVSLACSICCCCLQEKGYVTADVAEAEGLHQLKLSGTKFRKMLRAGEDIPEWCGLLLTQSRKAP